MADQKAMNAGIVPFQLDTAGVMHMLSLHSGEQLESLMAAGKLPRPKKLGRHNYWSTADVQRTVALIHGGPVDAKKAKAINAARRASTKGRRLGTS